MRKLIGIFTAAIVLSTFSNEILAEPQKQHLNMSIFSFVQDFFDTKPSIPFKRETELTLNVQPASWLDYFIFQKDWFAIPQKNEKLTDIKNEETTFLTKENTVISEKETSQTIVTPTSTIVVTKTSKITTKPETVNIGEMMQLLEEFGAGAAY